jgi:hypothetical protein
VVDARHHRGPQGAGRDQGGAAGEGAGGVAIERRPHHAVMAGLVPAIHVFDKTETRAGGILTSLSP